MQLLKQQYIDHRIQQHLESLKIPQTRQKLTREALVDALRKKGAFSLLAMHLHSPIAIKMRLCIYRAVSERIPLGKLLKKFKESMGS